MKLNKFILLSTVIAPVATVVSCGSDDSFPWLINFHRGINTATISVEKDMDEISEYLVDEYPSNNGTFKDREDFKLFLEEIGIENPGDYNYSYNNNLYELKFIWEEISETTDVERNFKFDLTVHEVNANTDTELSFNIKSAEEESTEDDDSSTEE